MSITTTVAVPATELPFGPLADVDGEVTLTVEPTVPTGQKVAPYVWTPAEVADSLVESLEENPVVETVSIVDETDEHALLKVAWTDRINGVLEAIHEHDVVVRGAVGTGTQWTFRLRFPSYEELSAFYASCVDRGVSVELVQLHQTVAPDESPQFSLTAPQQELLLAAYDAGYFDVPRRTTLVELGERLDISDSAVSQRLRRGLAALIESTLAAGSAPDEDSTVEAESDRYSNN